MQGKIYILRDQSKLAPMMETQWDAEHKLQELIAEYPDLLGGDQIDVENHRRWLLVTREMPMQGQEPNTTRLSLDHLFLDQDGIPTLVEVKRGSNAQVRREVVGQLLDYAAIATSSLNVRDIQAAFCSNRSSADSDLKKFLGEDANVEEFWQRVQSNLELRATAFDRFGRFDPYGTSPSRGILESTNESRRVPCCRSQAIRV